MKRFFAGTAALLAAVLFLSLPVGAISAQKAILLDAETGRVLYEENGYAVMPMASTTKIMTCILALESGKLKEYVTVSANAARQPKVRLGLKEGESYLLKDLLYSLMLESHNDTAVAIAEFVAGDVESFADMMNDKAVAFVFGEFYAGQSEVWQVGFLPDFTKSDM